MIWGFQRRLQTGQFLNIPLLDFCSRDPCPHGDRAGNIRLQHLIVFGLFLQSRQLFVNGQHFGFQFGDQLIVDLLVLLCGFRQIFNILLQIPFFAFQDLCLLMAGLRKLAQVQLSSSKSMALSGR